jgi:hypothetical protein
MTACKGQAATQEIDNQTTLLCCIGVVVDKVLQPCALHAAHDCLQRQKTTKYQFTGES